MNPVSTGERIAVIGSGTWGTTLAIVAARAGNDTALFVRDPDEATAIRTTRRQSRYLGDVPLPANIRVTADREEACHQASVILLVVPSQTMRENARQVAPFVGQAVIVSAAKGLERGTLKRMTEILAEEIGPDRPIVALSGPNLAKEVAAEMPATTVVAGTNLVAAERTQALLQSRRFRCYTNQDVIGVELGGALKNVLAIGAGLADGLGAGDNAKAAFLTRGIAEMARLGMAAGAQPLTFAGLAGLGDLIATCASPLSRNRRVGEELAQGRSLAEIQATMTQVAEGIFTTEAAVALGQRYDVELPITRQMHGVLFAGKPPLAAIAELMQREAKDELAGMSG